jgi:hypothetical protein
MKKGTPKRIPWLFFRLELLPAKPWLQASILQHIANAGYGLDILRVLRVRLQLSPKPANEDMQIFQFLAILSTPHPPQKFTAS